VAIAACQERADFLPSLHGGKSNHPAFIKTMKIQIDLKSALCGLIIGVAAMFAIGAGTSSNPVGRFQVETGASAINGGYAIILDTQTGQAWMQLAGMETDWGNNKADKFWSEK
jgi:hypothetical protein